MISVGHDSLLVGAGRLAMIVVMIIMPVMVIATVVISAVGCGTDSHHYLRIRWVVRRTD
jgi:hypothetical protein